LRPVLLQSDLSSVSARTVEEALDSAPEVIDADAAASGGGSADDHPL
jgi:hypothetical protein